MEVVLPDLLPQLSMYDAKKQVYASIILVATDVLGFLSADPELRHRDVCMRLIHSLLPWTLTNLGSVRGLTQHAVSHAPLLPSRSPLCTSRFTIALEPSLFPALLASVMCTIVVPRCGHPSAAPDCAVQAAAGN